MVEKARTEKKVERMKEKGKRQDGEGADCWDKANRVLSEWEGVFEMRSHDCEVSIFTDLGLGFFFHFPLYSQFSLTLYGIFGLKCWYLLQFLFFFSNMATWDTKTHRGVCLNPRCVKGASNACHSHTSLWKAYAFLEFGFFFNTSKCCFCHTMSWGVPDKHLWKSW